MKLKKYANNPILSPNAENEWESLVTCNPGVFYDKGTFYMLYRAAGNDKEHVIRFGLATGQDGFHFERFSNLPAFAPGDDSFDSGCVEDARIVKFDDEYYITYAYRPYPPGQYWNFEHDVVSYPESGDHTPLALKNNLGNSGLAVTKDFVRFRRLGRITSPVLDDRDVILFPEKIKGKYWMLHRPKEYVGTKYGADYPSIWIKSSDDLLNWEKRNRELPVKTIKVFQNGKKSFLQIVQEIKDLKINPENPDIMVCATKDNVYLSRNQGRSWVSLGAPPYRTNGIKAVAVANMPAGGGTGKELTVFLSHSVYGIYYIRPDTGVQWTELSTGLEKLETTGNADEVADITVTYNPAVFQTR